MDSNPHPDGAKPGALFYAGWLGVVAVVLLALAGLVLARSLWIGRQTAELKQREEQGALALVLPVAEAAGSHDIDLPGDVHGFFESPIYAKVSGYVKNVLVDKGRKVKANELLALIESPELDQQVVNAKADYDNKLITDRRYQSLVELRVVPQQTADDSHSAMLQARATWQSLVAQQAYENVRAPFDGIVIERNVDPGALVATETAQASATPPILMIATLRPVRVYVQMPQDQAAFVRDGDPAAIRVNQYPRREFKGAVTRHPPALAMATRTMLVEIDLPNQDLALYPGMYARVAIQVSGAPKIPLVPDSALIFNGAKTFVPVIRDSRVHLAEITLGYDDGINVQIVDGLNGDEIIATNLGQTPAEGELVHTMPQPQR